MSNEVGVGEAGSEKRPAVGHSIIDCSNDGVLTSESLLESRGKSIARVVIDSPVLELDREFDYSIPGRMRDGLSIGSTVIVPFSGARKIGYVVGLSDVPRVEKVLEIEDVVETEPSFDRRMLDLCMWVSERYLCTISEAVKLALPPGRSRRLEVVVKLCLEDLPESLPAAQKRICERILDAGGSASMRDLKKAFGDVVTGRVSALIKLGLAERRYSLLRPQAVEKTVRHIRAEVDPPALDGGLKRAPKQQALMNLLFKEGELPLREALLRSGASHAQAASLVAKGLASIEEKRCERVPEVLLVEEDRGFFLTDEQRLALDSIETALAEGRHEAFLLHGVTGSGKTEIYLRAISTALAMGKSAIVLVPEIALTSQMVARFKTRFKNEVALAHSGLSEGERYDQWEGVRSGKYRIVVGARSAIFAPVPNLGLIVVDEEHEGAYKQNNSPRYNAKDVALERGRLWGAPVVLGSATPSLETRLAAERGTATLLRLTARPYGRPQPEIELVDMRREPPREGARRTVSRVLETGIEEVLAEDGKAILLLNRRGFSNYILCPDCGFVPLCRKCAVSLNYHQVGRRLKCHHCDYSTKAPSVCPRCNCHRLFYKGAGTQRAEEEIAALFPGVPLIRMDADTTRRKNSHQRRLNQFRKEKKAILLGTQMIAKGLDFPDVLLVGVLDADTALYLPDFRSFERTYQLLMQVSGRAGRSERPGRVVLQTYSPDNPAIAAVLEGDYDSFFARECAAREALGYPPFSTVVRLLYTGARQQSVLLAAERCAKVIRACPGEILGPAPAPLIRVKGEYRYHLIVRTIDLRATGAFIRERLSELRSLADGSTLTVDVDPVWVL